MGNIIQWDDDKEREARVLTDLDNLGISFQPNDHWTNVKPAANSVFKFYAAVLLLGATYLGAAYLIRKAGEWWMR